MVSTAALNFTRRTLSTLFVEEIPPDSYGCRSAQFARRMTVTIREDPVDWNSFGQCPSGVIKKLGEKFIIATFIRPSAEVSSRVAYASEEAFYALFGSKKDEKIRKQLNECGQLLEERQRVLDKLEPQIRSLSALLPELDQHVTGQTQTAVRIVEATTETSAGLTGMGILLESGEEALNAHLQQLEKRMQAALEDPRRREQIEGITSLTMQLGVVKNEEEKIKKAMAEIHGILACETKALKLIRGRMKGLEGRDEELIAKLEKLQEKIQKLTKQVGDVDVHLTTVSA